MKTKADELELLNETDDPKSLGYERYADDGQNSYWVRKRGAVTTRLNRFESHDGEFLCWSDDVDGWEHPG